jgi:Squalene-hopene cyclase C-terminal domain
MPDTRPIARVVACVVAAALCALAIAAGPARCEAASDLQSGRAAIERALKFVDQDAVKWRQERGCVTCHHGTMTVWALGEAKSQGYAVRAEALPDVIQWVKDQWGSRIAEPRDPRPGWDLVIVPAIYLGVMSRTLPILSRDEIDQIATHLARHQEADGGWKLPGPSSGPPPTWESRETIALWAYLAWPEHGRGDQRESAANRLQRDRAAAFLAKVTPSDTTQATALWLLVDVHSGKSGEQLQSGIDRLLRRQNSDGGWGQIPDAPSDAYATGQSLYVLSFAGVKGDRPEIVRGVSFLVASQREDGSWPMTSRNHPGVQTDRNPIRNPWPITYFGSAWATLALVRSVPAPIDTPARQQRALDFIRGYGGTYEVDEGSPGRPVVHVDLRSYEKMDDKIVGQFTERLQAFPRLVGLQFRSPKITDAGLASLKRLPGLRSVSLENAAVTDAGLAELTALTSLEKLNVKGTRVTDAGVHALQKALPRAQVER